MKLDLVILLSVALLAANGYSQNAGGTGGTTPPGTPTGPTSPGAGGTPPPTLNPGIGETSFEAQRRAQPAAPTLPPDQAGQIVVSNGVIVTNLTPTSQPGFTNRIMATNGSRLMRDQAISEADRKLLGEIYTAVFGSAQPPAQLGGTSVHFILRDGAVRVVGFVPDAQEQKRIVTAVQGVSGVGPVYDALQIGVSAAPSQPQQIPAPTQAPAPQTPAPQTSAPGQPTPGQPQ